MRGFLKRWRISASLLGGSISEYPGVCYVGPLYDGYYCWEAKESFRHIFLELAPRIKTHLDNCCESIPSSDRVSFSLYAVGKSQNSAVPTIIFFCMDASQAKKARNLTKHSGLLKAYPEIKTAHSDRDPGVENLEQLAHDDSSTTQHRHRSSATEVFYDASEPILDLGMPIFVKHDDGPVTTMRRSTANTYRCGKRLFYLSVYHTFLNEPEPPPVKSPADCDDDVFGIDSDIDDEDESNIAITSTGSRSSSSSEYNLSSSNISLSRSAHSVSFSDSSTQAASTCPSSEVPAPLQDFELVNQSFTHYTNGDELGDMQIKDAPPVDIQSLAPLGSLHSWSTSKDWALIEITNQNVLENIIAMEDVSKFTYQTVAPSPRNNAQIVTRTASRGEMTGILSGTPSYSRLPHSESFEEVYRVRLNGYLENGVCGASIRDALTGETYGHIVLGCKRTGIAYIMAATHVFEDIKKHLDGISATSAVLQDSKQDRASSNLSDQETSFDVELTKLTAAGSDPLPQPDRSDQISSENSSNLSAPALLWSDRNNAVKFHENDKLIDDENDRSLLVPNQDHGTRSEMNNS
jgi:hypothetical protein